MTQEIYRSDLEFSLSKIKKNPPLLSFSRSLEMESSDNSISQTMAGKRLQDERQNIHLVAPEKLSKQYVSKVVVKSLSEQKCLDQEYPSGYTNLLSSQERKNTGRINRLTTTKHSSDGKAFRKANNKHLNNKRTFVSQYSTTLKIRTSVDEANEYKMTQEKGECEDSVSSTVRDNQGQSTVKISSSPDIFRDLLIDTNAKRGNLSMDSGLGSMVEALSPKKGEKEDFQDRIEDDISMKEADIEKTIMSLDSNIFKNVMPAVNIVDDDEEKFEEFPITQNPASLQVEDSSIANRKQKRKSHISFASKLGSIPEKIQPYLSNRCSSNVFVQTRRISSLIRCLNVRESKRNPVLLEASLKPDRKNKSTCEGKDKESIHVCKTWIQFHQGFSGFSISVQTPVCEDTGVIFNRKDEVAAISTASAGMSHQMMSQPTNIVAKKVTERFDLNEIVDLPTKKKNKQECRVYVQPCGTWKNCAVLVGAISYES